MPFAFGGGRCKGVVRRSIAFVSKVPKNMVDMVHVPCYNGGMKVK